MASSTVGKGKGPRMKIEASSTTSQPESAEPSVSTAPQVKPKVEAAPKAEAKPAPKVPAPRVEAAPKAEPAPAPAPAPKAPAQKPPASQAKAPRPTIVVSNDTPDAAQDPDEPTAQEYAKDTATYEWEEPEARQQANTQTGGQSQANQDTQAKGTSQGPTFKDAKRAASGWVHRTFPGHEYAFYGAIVAIVLALLVFAFGFVRMLFVCVLIVVGIAVGQIFDGDPKIIRAIRNLFSNEREQR
ncbi:MAG: DUF2273 domain-containing protein [Coriobacteriales bacterium]|nr:DUF2273 domain-containing protein [Coriobacteriales bacterium]